MTCSAPTAPEANAGILRGTCILATAVLGPFGRCLEVRRRCDRFAVGQLGVFEP
jgi:hypothetical protein